MPINQLITHVINRKKKQCNKLSCYASISSERKSNEDDSSLTGCSFLHLAIEVKKLKLINKLQFHFLPLSYRHHLQRNRGDAKHKKNNKRFYKLL